jgi:hypothetical protein
MQKRLSYFADVSCLWALLSFDDLELHLIAFLKTLVTFRCYCTVVDENIGAILAPDKAESLSIVEPLYGSFHT